MFLSTMREKAQRKWDQYPGLFDLKKAMSATTLEAFDDAFTAPLHGFKGVNDYWKKASAKPVIKQVRIPTLLMNAVNDPFVPARSLPMQEEVGSMTTVWRPHNGGHVGFVEPIGPQDWRGHVLAMPRAVCAWLAQRGLNG
jgi:predicted alpha/beta-fold hydrolase